MKNVSQRISTPIIVISGLVSLLISCDDSSSGGGDPFLLWKQQSNDQVVFVSQADSSEGELYLLDQTGTITRLTDNTRFENNPALSPDGKKVAFHGGTSSLSWSWEIFILDLETGVETKLTTNYAIDGHPDWSPDGSRIIFTSFSNCAGVSSSKAEICVMDVDGTNVSNLTNSSEDDADAEWSPDGSMIVFKSTRNTQTSAREEIYVMDSDGSNVRKLTTTSGWESEHDPSWSPDSKTIVFNRYEGSRPWTDMTNISVLQSNWQELVPWNVYKVDLSGNSEKLTDYDYIIGLPVFSAGGSTILVLQYDFIFSGGLLAGMYHRFILMNADGSNQVQLLPDDAHTPTLEYFDW